MLLNMISEKESKAQFDKKYLDSCILRVADKSEEAFKELYDLTSSSVYAYALSIMKNTYDAEDVMHDCFVAVYGAAKDYVPCGKPLNWILTVTKNMCYQKIREREKFSDIPEEDWERTLSEKYDLTVEDKLVIEKCMSVLTDEERQIVVLHAVAGFKHREIALHVGLPLPTVLSKYNRSIKKLKQELEKEEMLYER